MQILDSHVHFVDPSKPGGIDWPSTGSPLRRAWLPQDLVAANVGVIDFQCVAVETSRRSVDDEWLLNLAETTPLIAGAVLNLQPDLPGSEERLQEAAQSNAFVGIRLRPIDQYELSSATLNRSFLLLQEAGKTIEFGAKTDQQKQAFAEFADRYSETTWVLDHCGHPGSSPDEAWQKSMRRIAAAPNTIAKVSGLQGDPDHVREILAHLMDWFGPERLLYASNWPVCTLADGDSSTEVIREFFAEDGEAFFAANARRAYGL